VASVTGVGMPEKTIVPPGMVDAGVMVPSAACSV